MLLGLTTGTTIAILTIKTSLTRILKKKSESYFPKQSTILPKAECTFSAYTNVRRTNYKAPAHNLELEQTDRYGL
jgi:hypothetical protein